MLLIVRLPLDSARVMFCVLLIFHLFTIDESQKSKHESEKGLSFREQALDYPHRRISFRMALVEYGDSFTVATFPVPEISSSSLMRHML